MNWIFFAANANRARTREESGSQERNNHFDLLRLLAAFSVIWSHCHDLLRVPDRPLVFGMSMSTIGLTVFFSISGFLVSGSALSQPNYKAFFQRRVLRIWPGLAFNILILTLFVGPFFTTLPLHVYVLSPQSWLYLAGLFIYTLRWQLPGVWQTNPTSAINGSLWTIPHEFTLYLITWGLKKSKILSRWQYLLLVILPISLIIDLNFAGLKAADPHVFLLSIRWILHFGSLFLIGAFFRTIWTFGRVKYLLAGVALTLQFGFSTPGHWHFFTFYAAAGTILIVAFLPGGWIFSKLSRGADLSYGLYLWGFPVQQIVIHYLGSADLSPVQLFALTTTITVPLSIASWFFIEKPALSWVRRAKQKPTL